MRIHQSFYFSIKVILPLLSFTHLLHPSYRSPILHRRSHLSLTWYWSGQLVPFCRYRTIQYQVQLSLRWAGSDWLCFVPMGCTLIISRLTDWPPLGIDNIDWLLILPWSRQSQQQHLFWYLSDPPSMLFSFSFLSSVFLGCLGDRVSLHGIWPRVFSSN